MAARIPPLAVPVVAAALLLATTYVAYPCVTLYRLDGAVARNDAKMLRQLIDWPEVQQGIEADLSSGQELAPFGAAFLRDIAVRASITPENVLAALRADEAWPGGALGVGQLRGAWLEGPDRLMLDVGAIRLRLELRGGVWRVTRAWLPEAMLVQARTEARRQPRG